MAISRNLYVDQYSIFSDDYIVKQDDGSIAVLTGYSARGTIKKSLKSTTSIDMSANISAPLSGKISIFLSAETTGSMSPGRYVYDIVVDDSNGTVIRVVEGILVVNPGVTQ